MASFTSYFYPVILGVPILFDQLFKWMFHKDCLFRAHFSTPLSTLQVFLVLLLHILRLCNAPPLCAARFLETDFQSFTCQLRNSVIKPGYIDHIFWILQLPFLEYMIISTSDVKNLNCNLWWRKQKQTNKERDTTKTKIKEWHLQGAYILMGGKQKSQLKIVSRQQKKKAPN